MIDEFYDWNDYISRRRITRGMLSLSCDYDLHSTKCIAYLAWRTWIATSAHTLDHKVHFQGSVLWQYFAILIQQISQGSLIKRVVLRLPSLHIDIFFYMCWTVEL